MSEEEIIQEDLAETDEIYNALFALGRGHHVGPFLCAVIHYIAVLLHYVVKPSPEELKTFVDNILYLYRVPPPNPFNSEEKEAE